MRRTNPAREATPTPPVSLQITEADFLAARELWRKHAPRRYWGLLEAPKDLPPAPGIPKPER